MKQSSALKRSCNYKKTTKTLDSCHKHNLETFEKNSRKIDELVEELKVVSDEIDRIEAKPNREKTDNEFRNIVNLRETKAQLTTQIEQMRSRASEISYFANTSDILYNYYNIVENNTDERMQSVFSSKNTNTGSGGKSIIDYFKTPSKTPNVSPSVTPATVPKTEMNRAALLDEYLSYTDNDYINDSIDNNQAICCSHCGSLEKTVLYHDSLSYCNKCYAIDNLLTDNEKPSYKDPPKEISYFSYKRINHYQEWLNQIQGKETTDIPEEVFDKILLELKKQRIVNVQDLNRRKIKEILKKLKINKYYEHIPYILNRITGIPNPNLTQELEEKLRNMFKEIQVPFLKHSPLNRKNFLSYSYVIHKFIQLLEKDEYLKYFPLLKSRDKLHQQEKIWRNICQDLGWKFIRSI